MITHRLFAVNEKFVLTFAANLCNIYVLSLSVPCVQAKCPKGGAKNMPKITGKYETVFIVNATLSEEAIKALV